MLSLVQAILLGILQGMTEWLPVSSSGHLVIAQHLLSIRLPVLFDVFLHCGTLFALLYFFRKDILQIIKTTLTLDLENDKLPLLIFVGSIPTAIMGFVFHDFFVSLFTIRAVGVTLLFTAVILFFARERGKNSVTWFSAFCVGIAQGISIIPGISRSGMTIATSLFLGIERNEAMRFSFLLSVPAVIGAMALETYDTSLQNIQWVPVIGGIFTSATVGYLSLIVLADVMMKGKVHYFSIYCFLVGVFAIIVSFLN